MIFTSPPYIVIEPTVRRLYHAPSPAPYPSHDPARARGPSGYRAYPSPDPNLYRDEASARGSGSRPVRQGYGRGFSSGADCDAASSGAAAYACARDGASRGRATFPGGIYPRYGTAVEGSVRGHSYLRRGAECGAEGSGGRVWGCAVGAGAESGRGRRRRC